MGKKNQEDEDLEEIHDRFSAALARRDFGEQASKAVVQYVMEQGSAEGQRSLERAAVRRICNSIHNLNDSDLRNVVGGFMQNEVLKEMDKYAMRERIEKLIEELIDDKLEEVVQKALDTVVASVAEDIRYRLTRKD